ncbi:MAG: sulfite exporter TauE/SafE family protein [Pseudomonadota bacterium]
MADAETSFFLFMLVGFIAQLIDGALGMAYGVASTTALIALGMSPAAASANVHTAEIFTTAASGASHAAARNINWRLLRALAPVGVAGGVLGATLVSIAPLDWARPVIAAYLFMMGIVVIRKAMARHAPVTDVGKVRALGFFGGFFDAFGGGGWGPAVASNLIARGGDAARMIGTVSLAEFFMTTAASAAFFAALGPTFGVAAAGLVAGGLIAAPIAAYGAKRAPRRLLTVIVGAVICLLSGFNFVWSFI